MFRAHIEADKLIIPTTNYSINPRGVITSNTDDSILEPYKDENDDLRVDLNLFRKPYSPRVIDLLAMVYKGLPFREDVLNHISAFLIYNAKSKRGYDPQLHAKNISFRFIRPLEHHYYRGFYYPQGLYNRLVNREGVVINYEGKRIKQINHQTVGSITTYTFYAKQNKQKTKIAVAKLLLLAFKKMPFNILNNRVRSRHDNGDEFNLENITWMYEGNISEKAIDAAKERNSIPVLLRNVETKEVTRFYSFKAAARFLKTQPANFRNVLNFKPFGTTLKGYQLKRVDDERDWVEPFVNLNTIYKDCVIRVTDIETNKATFYTTQSECARELKLNDKTISYHINRNLSGKRSITGNNLLIERVKKNP